MKYDYVVVGCGLFGATFARQMTDAGGKVLVIDRRDHIAGNCFDRQVQGINIHSYGPHQFHTRSRRIWEFVNRFAEFNHYRAHIKASHDGGLYSFPPNMMLYQQLWGVTTPAEAERKLQEVRIPCHRPSNLREYILDKVGMQVYETFYEGYTRKQWNMDPEDIPVSTAMRLPIRLTWNDRYFDDAYEGIPIGGYTKMASEMLRGVEVMLGVDFLSDRPMFERMSKKIAYTGKLDEFFDFRFGDLGYRSLRFEEEVLDCEDFQGNAIINFPSLEVPYTRITEHKHFDFTKSPKTVITREYPQDCDRGRVPFYPINDARNKELYGRYRAQWDLLPGYIGGGRLFEHRYYDMDQVIGAALSLSRQEGALQASLPAPPCIPVNDRHGIQG